MSIRRHGQSGASAEARAADIEAAFADPSIRAVLAPRGGDDQVTVIPHINTEILASNPKPFLGYSDNTNLHNLLWSLGVPSYYGGSTQVHLGPGPHVDDVHLASLRAALLDGGSIDLTEPGESEDFGISWTDRRALKEFGIREPADPWAGAGANTVAEGPTWGGCIEVIDQIALANRMPDVADLEGAILLLETSEELPNADTVKRWVRALGERGHRQLQLKASVLRFSTVRCMRRMLTTPHCVSVAIRRWAPLRSGASCYAWASSVGN